LILLGIALLVVARRTHGAAIRKPSHKQRFHRVYSAEFALRFTPAASIFSGQIWNCIPESAAFRSRDVGRGHSMIR
jgi:hypothetical protein